VVQLLVLVVQVLVLVVQLLVLVVQLLVLVFQLLVLVVQLLVLVVQVLVLVVQLLVLRDAPSFAWFFCVLGGFHDQADNEGMGIRVTPKPSCSMLYGQPPPAPCLPLAI
jgi:hypothetical protein